MSQIAGSRRPSAIAALLPMVVVAACGLGWHSVHVRDGLGLFSTEARAQAEDRLRELASQRGVLLYVVTDSEADPPRMLDAPMADAEARGLAAVAVLIGPGGIVGIGTGANQDVSFDAPSASYRFLEEGRGDEALDALVNHFAAWSRDPDGVGPQPPAIAPQPS